ncbi:lecithin retinol acyltransferase family protein [Yersinia enterocolitica]|uniref:LRAT domain-containing protein n=1 Tax=Yersinia intermedia TaxID=631 RepID=A0A0T9M8L8_YERIN|nr:lecithin retinol acyltransferase family protein [Yersinia intermedia]CNF78921.1 Uncharacterised protein [Yersinia intermedia]CNJ98476.1 Uncharacterised protein [Yersinia intermedia]
MLLTVSRLLLCYPLLRLLESFTDNVIRATIDEPAIGGMVWCELAGGTTTHSGIYVGHQRIVHLSGSGDVLLSNRYDFLNRLEGYNTALSLYTDCHGTHPVGNTNAAKRALSQVGIHRRYHLLNNNCHRFTAECVTGKINPGVFLHRHLSALQRGNDWRVWEK